uniref:Probable U2 small nuclear ribonucleoprotein A' n=1 Tax=Aceria tosichella TaxID=561515 RepID=A0A6G1SEG8_9ACAR
MRITSELIENSYQYTNKATTDRELRLRALKLEAIENLGATLNQFDCFDLSDNCIRKLENFPLLPRLKCLLLSHNRIYKIAKNLDQSIPNLERLILTNNCLQELSDIDPLANLKNLKVLSLLNNPVASKDNYRYYVIHKLPHLKLLDFNKVKRSEREQAMTLFDSDTMMR